MDYEFNILDGKGYIDIEGDDPICGPLSVLINSFFIENIIELILDIHAVLAGTKEKIEFNYYNEYICVEKNGTKFSSNIYDVDGSRNYDCETIDTIEFLNILEGYVKAYCEMTEVDDDYYYKTYQR